MEGSLKVIIEKHPDVKNWDNGYDILCEFLDKIKSDRIQKAKMCIVCDEIYSNISKYAYEGKKGKIEMDLEFNPKNLKFIITFIDSGVYYDPTKKKEPDVKKGLEDRKPGGLGLFIVNQIMDRVEYRRKSNKNYLKLEKKLKVHS